MGTKRATIRDVAKLAGVGVTTVSYVINGRSKEMRVSETTTKKVLQVANALNYSPNPLAVALKTNSVRIVAVRTGSSSGTLQNLEVMSLLDELISIMQQNEYSLTYNPSKTVEKISAEACICYNMSNEEFFALGDENFIPLVALDSIIDDPMFYQVNPDYRKIKSAADVYFHSPADAFFHSAYDYISVATANEALRAEILSVFPDTIFVSELSDLQKFKPSANLLLSHSSLFKAFAHLDKTINILRYDTHLAVRPQVLFNSIRNAVNRIAANQADHSMKI